MGHYSSFPRKPPSGSMPQSLNPTAREIYADLEGRLVSFLDIKLVKKFKAGHTHTYTSSTSSLAVIRGSLSVWNDNHGGVHPRTLSSRRREVLISSTGMKGKNWKCTQAQMLTDGTALSSLSILPPTHFGGTAQRCVHL